MSTEDDLFASFEAQFSDITVDDVEDISKLSDLELMDRMAIIDADLTGRGELLQPRTQEGRDLHSTRSAIRIEQLKRETG